MFGKIERGTRFSKRSHVVMLAECFYVNADELLTLWLADKMIYAVKGEKKTK